MSVSARIKARRTELGLSQEALARKLDVAKNSVSRWETEKASPEGKNLVNLALALDVTTDWIMRGDDRPAGATAPDPPYWREFLDNYPDLERLGEEDIADIKRALNRGGRKVRSWSDYIPIANALRDLQPSPTFEAKKRAREERSRDTD